MKLLIMRKPAAVIAAASALFASAALATSANAVAEKPASASTSTAIDTPKALVNVTILNVPGAITNPASLSREFRVCALPLAPDATGVAYATITSCPHRYSVPVKIAKLSNGILTGTVRVKAAGEEGKSQNYALYVIANKSRHLKTATQFGIGQFVSVSNHGSVATVDVGQDGLSLDWSLNTGYLPSNSQKVQPHTSARRP